jgi:ADP-heptose:LPS heptosyltransferase
MNTILWLIGTLLCWPFLAIAARRSCSTERKILIIQWAKLGDMVCTTPMFRALKEAYPDWEVHLLCRASNLAVVANNPFIDRVIVPPTRRSAIIRMLRPERYDAVINCLPGSFWSMLGLWLGAPDRINTPSSKHGHIIRWSRIFNTVHCPYRIGMSTFDHYLSLLKPLGVPKIPYVLDFFPSAEDTAFAKSWIKNPTFVMFNVSAGNAIKEWPEEKFAELADRLDLPIVISTIDSEKVERIKRLSKHPEKLIDGSSLTLGQMGALSTRAKAFVAVDTGPMFVAYACGVKVVVLVGGSDPREQIPPEGERVVHVLPPAGCTPWMHVTLSPRTATAKQLRCIRETPVESVAAALQRFL